MPPASRALNWPALSVLAAACAVLLWVYAPGVYGPALFDDFVVLSNLEGASSSWQSASEAVGRDDSGPVGRPVAIASFVLEDRLLGESLAVTKGVNIALHGVNLLLVAWLLQRLLRPLTPRTIWIALIAAFAWAASPLLVSTTLYAVQRMALLSATFSVLALIVYDYWRCCTRPEPRHHVGFAALLLLTSLLAVLAKENAVALAPMLLILELGWYRFDTPKGKFSPTLMRIWCVALVLIAVCGTVLLYLQWPRFSDAYAFRDFTLAERLLAEGAILVDYVMQLFWPDTARMGLYHDDAQRLFAPERGVRAWLLVLFWPLLLLGPLLLYRLPFLARLSVGPALFFAAHLLESTIIPLELYFEHRNYFPAVFLFLALAYVLAELVRRAPALLPPLGALLSLLLLVQLSMTSVQVQLWSSQSLLRLAHVQGHPQSFRANYDMAVELAERGALTGALQYSQRAHEAAGESDMDGALRDVLLDCLAGGSGDTVAALPSGGRVALNDPHTLRMLVSYGEREECGELPLGKFAQRLHQLLQGAPPEVEAPPVTYFLLALLDNALGEGERALLSLARYNSIVRDDADALLFQLHLALVSSSVEHEEEARRRLRELLERDALSSQQRATLALYPE